MAPSGESTGDVIWAPPLTWEEWVENTRNATFSDTRRVIERFNASLPLVRSTLYRFVDGMGRLSVWSAAVLVIALHLVAAASSPLVVSCLHLCFGVFMASIAARAAQNVVLCYVIRNAAQYHDFLFDHWKWKVVRFALCTDMPVPSRPVVDHMLDAIVRDRIGELAEAPTIDDINLLMRQLHSRLLLSYSAWYLDILRFVG
jgi:hypothetical protein